MGFCVSVHACVCASVLGRKKGRVEVSECVSLAENAGSVPHFYCDRELRIELMLIAVSIIQYIQCSVRKKCEFHLH